MSKQQFEAPGFIIAIDHHGIASLLRLPELTDKEAWIEDDLSEFIREEEYPVTPGVYRATYYFDAWRGTCGECDDTESGFKDLTPIWTTEGFKP